MTSRRGVEVGKVKNALERSVFSISLAIEVLADSGVLLQIQGLFDRTHEKLRRAKPAERRRIIGILVQSVSYTLESEDVDPELVRYFRRTAVEHWAETIESGETINVVETIDRLKKEWTAIKETMDLERLEKERWRRFLWGAARLSGGGTSAVYFDLERFQAGAPLPGIILVSIAAGIAFIDQGPWKLLFDH